MTIFDGQPPATNLLEITQEQVGAHLKPSSPRGKEYTEDITAATTKGLLSVLEITGQLEFLKNGTFMETEDESAVLGHSKDREYIAVARSDFHPVVTKSSLFITNRRTDAELQTFNAELTCDSLTGEATQFAVTITSLDMAAQHNPSGRHQRIATKITLLPTSRQFVVRSSFGLGVNTHVPESLAFLREARCENIHELLGRITTAMIT